jgi:hypothetical protein
MLGDVEPGGEIEAEDQGQARSTQSSQGASAMKVTVRKKRMVSDVEDDQAVLEPGGPRSAPK